MFDCTQRICEETKNDKQQVATLYILGTSYPIFTGINNVGRDTRTSDIFIDDPTVSQSHAVIRVYDHRHVILDLRSTNKTVLDSEGPLLPYDHYDLKHKSTLKFGNVSGQYFFDEMELESQKPPIQNFSRPANPLEKVLESSTDSQINFDATDDSDRLAISTSPILDSSLSNRRLKSSSSRSLSPKTVIELSDSKRNTNSNEIKFSDASIHEAETQVSNIAPKATCQKNSLLDSSERLILSETLHDDNTSLSDKEMFVPETQNFAEDTPVLYQSVADSELDDTDQMSKSNNTCDADLNEIINYQEDSNSSVYEIVSSQCLLRSFSDLSKSVEKAVDNDIIIEGTNNKSDNDITDCEDCIENSDNEETKPKVPAENDELDINKSIEFLDKASKDIDEGLNISKSKGENVNGINISPTVNIRISPSTTVVDIHPTDAEIVTERSEKLIHTEKSKDMTEQNLTEIDISDICTQKVPTSVSENLQKKLIHTEKSKEMIHDLSDACTQKIPTSISESLQKNNAATSLVNNEDKEDCAMKDERFVVDKQIEVDISDACTQIIPISNDSGNKYSDKNKFTDISDQCTQKLPTPICRVSQRKKKLPAKLVDHDEVWNMPTQKLDSSKKSSSKSELDSNISDTFNQPTKLTHDISDMPTQIITAPVPEVINANQDSTVKSNVRKTRNSRKNHVQKPDENRSTEVNSKSCKGGINKYNKSISSKDEIDKCESELKMSEDSICDQTTIMLPRSSISARSSPQICENINLDTNKILISEASESFNITSISEIASDAKSNCFSKKPHASSYISSTPMVSNKKFNNNGSDESLNLIKNKTYDTIVSHRSISDESIEDSEAELMAENSMKIDAEKIRSAIQPQQIFGDSSDNENKRENEEELSIAKNKQPKKRKVLNEKSARNSQKKKKGKNLSNLFGDTEDDTDEAMGSPVRKTKKYTRNVKKLDKKKIKDLSSTEIPDKNSKKVSEYLKSTEVDADSSFYKELSNSKANSSRNIQDDAVTTSTANTKIGHKSQELVPKVVLSSLNNIDSESDKTLFIDRGSVNPVENKTSKVKTATKIMDSESLENLDAKRRKSSRKQVSGKLETQTSSSPAISKKKDEEIILLEENLKEEKLSGASQRKSARQQTVNNSSPVISKMKKDDINLDRSKSEDVNSTSGINIRKSSRKVKNIQNESQHSSKSSISKKRNELNLEEKSESSGVCTNTNLRYNNKKHKTDKLESQTPTSPIISKNKTSDIDSVLECSKNVEVSTTNQRKSSRKRMPSIHVSDNKFLQSISLKADHLENSNTSYQRQTKRQLSHSRESENSDVENACKKKKENEHIDPKQVSKSNTSSSISEKSGSNFKILITSVSDDTLPDLITKLGGIIVENHNQCTVLIAPRIIRTVKFLCCLAKGIPIVSVDWLIQSSKVHKFLDPWDYITKDKAGEQKYKFNLKNALKRAQGSPLLKDYTVMGTKSILPLPRETKDIVESCGGTFVTTSPRSGFKNPSFIISCEEDKKFWPKKTGRKYIPPIVKSEALLTGILHQKLHLSQHLLTE